MIVLINLFKIFMNFIYFFIKLFPTKNKITMISRESNSEVLDFRLLREEIERRNDFQVVVLCKKLEGNFFNKIGYLFHMFKQMYHIATSKIVVLDTYCICISILKHKKSLKVVQIWHSMGTMKKFGYSAMGLEEGRSEKVSNLMNMHKNYDYIFASSEAYKDHLAKGFNYDEKYIYTFPLPRYDLLISKEYDKECKKKIYSKYKRLKKKENILYCPTFRKNNNSLENALKELIDAVDYSKYNLIIKLHPLDETYIDIDNDSVIFDTTFSTSDMLCVSDYVISDYSCVIYEAAVKNIPIHFYNYDYDEYETRRGLAIDYYKELPGVISSSPREIINGIKYTEKDMEKLVKFSNKYVKPTKSATGDIVEFLYNIAYNK